METMTKEINQSQSSVEISINAKGLWSGKVKAYADTVDEAQELALLKANDLNTKIVAKNGL